MGESSLTHGFMQRTFSTDGGPDTVLDEEDKIPASRWLGNRVQRIIKVWGGN